MEQDVVNHVGEELRVLNARRRAIQTDGLVVGPEVVNGFSNARGGNGTYNRD